MGTRKEKLRSSSFDTTHLQAPGRRFRGPESARVDDPGRAPGGCWKSRSEGRKGQDGSLTLHGESTTCAYV